MDALQTIAVMQATTAPTTTLIQLLGAGAFGLIIGWYVYYINRYRKGDVQLGDLATLVGVIGGGAILALFPQGSDLFGAYGIGLAIGYFLYFIVLLVMVRLARSNFSVEYFLDGRRRLPDNTVGWPEGWQQPVRAFEEKMSSDDASKLFPAGRHATTEQAETAPRTTPDHQP